MASIKKREENRQLKTFELGMSHADIVEYMNNPDLLLDNGDVESTQEMQLILQKPDGTELFLHDFIPVDKIIFRFKRLEVIETATEYEATCAEFEEI